MRERARRRVIRAALLVAVADAELARALAAGRAAGFSWDALAGMVGSWVPYLSVTSVRRRYADRVKPGQAGSVLADLLVRHRIGAP